MVDCPEVIGLRNVLISFRDCDSGNELRNVVHKASTDTLPTFNLCPYTYTALPGGKVQRSEGTGVTLDLEVEVVTSIPTAYYTGCAAIDVTLEYYDGSVRTFMRGAIIDSGGTDGHTVAISAVFRDADEILAESPMSSDAA